MKIALVCLNFSDERGGTRMPYLLARGIKNAGHDITVYAAKFNPEVFPWLRTNFVVREIPAPVSGGIFQKTAIQKIKERLKRESLNTKAVLTIAKALPRDLDVIICYNDQSYKLGRFLRATLPRTKFIWVMDNAPFRHTRKNNFLINTLSIVVNLFERLRVRFYLPYIDVVVVNDEEHRRLLRLVGREARLVPIPVDFEKFYREISVKNSTEPVLLGVGALSPARKFEDIIAAGKILRQSGIKCRVILVCHDSWNADVYREKLVGLVKEIDGGSWVEFHFAGVSDAELLKIQAESFVYIFPNHIRIGGMAATEAMAAGIPLVVSNSTSVAEMLQDGKNALFVNPGHPEEIAEKIKLLLSDPQKYQSIAKTGQQFVKENLRFESYIEAFLDGFSPKI